ncbi:MAG TPA: hypothetical protein VKR06_01000 [Ktedonosporobacter sp.]|nr:hypothetical protein [Ktedonosporobacter sp.]
MEVREPFPPTTDIPLLKQAGFSNEQIAGLFRVKLRHQRGVYHETIAERRRQEFVRWLYRQGRLQS